MSPSLPTSTVTVLLSGKELEPPRVAFTVTVVAPAPSPTEAGLTLNIRVLGGITSSFPMVSVASASFPSRRTEPSGAPAKANFTSSVSPAMPSVKLSRKVSSASNN